MSFDDRIVLQGLGKLRFPNMDLVTFSRSFSFKIEMVQRRAARFVYNDYSRFSHVSAMIDALGWDSLEHHRFANQMFYKIYKGHIAISLPAVMSRNKEFRVVATVHLFTNLVHQMIRINFLFILVP